MERAGLDLDFMVDLEAIVDRLLGSRTLFRQVADKYGTRPTGLGSMTIIDPCRRRVFFNQPVPVPFHGFQSSSTMMEYWWIPVDAKSESMFPSIGHPAIGLS
jgi:hypothetical protein